MVLRKQHSANTMSFSTLQVERRLLYEVLRERKVSVRDRVRQLERNIAAVRALRESKFPGTTFFAKGTPVNCVALSDLMIMSLNGVVEERDSAPCTLPVAEFDAAWLPFLLDGFAAAGIPTLEEWKEARKRELLEEAGHQVAAAPLTAAERATEEPAKVVSVSEKRDKRISFAPETTYPTKESTKGKSMFQSVANKLRKGLHMEKKRPKQQQVTFHKPNDSVLPSPVAHSEHENAHAASNVTKSGNGIVHPKSTSHVVSKSQVGKQEADKLDRKKKATAKRKFTRSLILGTFASILDVFGTGVGALKPEEMTFECSVEDQRAAEEAAEAAAEQARMVARQAHLAALTTVATVPAGCAALHEDEPDTRKKKRRSWATHLYGSSETVGEAVPCSLDSPCSTAGDKHSRRSSLSTSSSETASMRQVSIALAASLASGSSAGISVLSMGTSPDPTLPLQKRRDECEYSYSMEFGSERELEMRTHSGPRSSEDYAALGVYFNRKLIDSLRNSGGEEPASGSQGQRQQRSTFRSRLASKSRSTMMSAYSTDSVDVQPSFKRLSDRSCDTQLTMLDESDDNSDQEQDAVIHDPVCVVATF